MSVASFTHDVFLSYSSQDKAIVHPLAERLKKDGLRVWLDAREIRAGDNIPSKIEEGLENSAVLVLCMSANAFGSDWSRLESQTFRFRDPLNKDRRFIPLRLDDTEPKGSLRQFAYIDWRNGGEDDDYQRLLEACQQSKTMRSDEILKDLAIAPGRERIGSFGHTDAIRSVALSGDGKHALSASDDKTMRLWDVESGRTLRVFEGHARSVLSAAFSGDGKRALSGAADNMVRLWDVESGRTLRVFEGHTGSVWSVAFSGDGKRALSGSFDRAMRLWDVESGRTLRVFEGHTGSVWSVALSRDGKRALSGSFDRAMRLWDVESGRTLRTFEGHSESVESVALSGDGKHALSGSEDNTVRLWDVETGTTLRIFQGHTGSIWSVALSGDGKRALSGAVDKMVRLWDVESGRTLRAFEGHSESVESVALSRDDKRALSGSEDNTVRLWDVESGRALRVSEGHTKIVGSVAFSGDGQCAVSGSADNTMRLWDVKRDRALQLFKSHFGPVLSVALSADGKRALSGSEDQTVRLWDVESGRTLRVFEGHIHIVTSVAFSVDGRYALSGSEDTIVRLWDVESGGVLRVFEGHADKVWSVAFSADGQRALSGSSDRTLRLWDVESGRTLRVFVGHTDDVWGAVLSGNGKRALSASGDNTVRVWDADTGRTLRIFEGHTDMALVVAFSADGYLALSGSADRTVRLWDVESGRTLRVFEGHTDRVCSVAFSPDGDHAFSAAENGVWRSWNLTEAVAPNLIGKQVASLAANEIQYTNAKVLLVGESGSGKTGLTERLAQDQPPQRVPSTSGTWSTQWLLKDLPQEPGWEREVWLWDFGGQADQRLIHQLFVDRAALVLLMFDADKEAVLPGLREWQQALARSMNKSAPTFLLAGRTDVGSRFDRAKVRDFAKVSGYEYFETSSETGSGIAELRKAMLGKIPWKDLPRHSSPAIFKRLKDEILKLRDEGQVLLTFKELESILRRRLPPEMEFADAQLETVLSLLDGPGVVKQLNFGAYTLLRPEWINIYAQAVIRTLRAAESGLGYLPVNSIMEGKLVFQSGDDGAGAEKRLGAKEERVILQDMEQTLLERRLCLRQGGDLVFPSYCGVERPAGPVPPQFFVSYTIRGFLDDIYATLVVKLAHCGVFKLKELWRDAADFETLAERKIVGVKLLRRDDGRGDLLAHHGRGIAPQELVIFANYIHEHLSEKSTEEVPRLRYYACSNCHEPIENRKLAMELLEKNGEEAKIRCQRCDRFVALWDKLEELFADPELKSRVQAARRYEQNDLESRRQGKLLVLEVSARITSANQKCHEIPGDQDEGIDLVVEFTDAEGRGTGKHMYVQLKAGNSHLEKRKDGSEVFRIKKQSWVKQWSCQDGPMMLVIGTFPEGREYRERNEKKQFEQVRWMEIGELLRSESDNGKKPVKQILFQGERLDALSVSRWRDRVLKAQSEAARV